MEQLLDIDQWRSVATRLARFAQETKRGNIPPPFWVRGSDPEFVANHREEKKGAAHFTRLLQYLVKGCGAFNLAAFHRALTVARY